MFQPSADVTIMQLADRGSEVRRAANAAYTAPHMDHRRAGDQAIPDALVITFGMVVLDVRGEEGLPRHLRAAFWCGVDARVLQDGFNRVPREVVAEVLQRAADTSIAPGRTLVRHAHDECGDVRLRGRSPGRRFEPSYFWATSVRYHRRIVRVSRCRPRPRGD